MAESTAGPWTVDEAGEPNDRSDPRRYWPRIYGAPGTGACYEPEDQMLVAVVQTSADAHAIVQSQRIASIPTEAREALADYFDARHAMGRVDFRFDVEGFRAAKYVYEGAVERVTDLDAWGHLPTLAAALRRVGDA